MGKYIIELDEDPHNIRLMQLKNGVDGVPVTEFKVVCPYKEHDLEQVKREAYREGREDGVHDGMYDAWDAARKISMAEINGHCSWKTMKNIFGYDVPSKIFKNFTASEVIEEIRAYEQAQKEKESEESKKEQSVTAEEVMRQYLDTFCKVNRCRECVLHTSDFTCGRGYHFLTNNPVSDEEVRKAYATVLEKMRKE